MVKPFSLYLFVSLALLPGGASARDLGVRGHVFKIEEENFLKVIQQRINEFQESGKLEVLNETIKRKIVKRVGHPASIKGVKDARMTNKRLYDPSLILQEDLKDHRGQVIHPKGKKINPLDTYSWGSPLLLFDGGDKSQVEWAKSQGPSKWVLVGGKPLDLEKEFKREVFFDQGGLIVQKLKITQVPCRVSQEGKFLLIEEICLTEN